MLLLVLLPLLVVAVLLARATRVTPTTVEEWARSRALVLTPENRPMVVWYLRTARVLRTLGVAAGFVLPSLVVLALGGHVRFPQHPAWLFVGYLVGALYAEVSLVRPAGHRATLSPRRLGDYLPRRLLVAQRTLGALTVTAAVLALSVPAGERWSLGSVRTWLVATAVAAPLLAGGLEVVERWLVRRPQPVVSASLLAADDAIRSQSVHSVAGSGIAVQLLVLDLPLWALAASDVPLLRWTLTLPALLAWLAALYVCLYYGHRAWRVRRPRPVAR